MKKYLIKGLLALFVGGLTASCADDVDYIPLAQQKTKAYTEAFKELIGGDVDPTQNWGFEGLTISEIEGAGARANTRFANTDGNLWYKDWERPVNVTDAEREKVLEEFSKVRVGEVNSVHIDWNNYWVQQVWKGTTHYTDGYGNDVLGSNQMDHLLAYSSKKTEVITWWDPATQGPLYGLADKTDNFYEHINNFNSGSNNTEYTDDETHEKYIGTTLMTDMYADGIIDQFGYHNSTDSKDHYEYIILEIDGAYYVGFDFYAQHPEGQEANKNMDVERDWIFNDWIVKISPAIKKGGDTPGGDTPGGDTPGGNTPGGGTATTSKTVKQKWSYKKLVSQGRVFCEDLGTAGLKDLDFNDIVFDARIWAVQDFVTTTVDDGTPEYSDWTSWKYEVDLCLLAAGGTIPAKVLGNDVHTMFDPNIGQTTMINTVDDHSGTLTYWENQSTVVAPKTFYGLNITDLINSLTADPNHKITPADITISVLWADSEDPAKFGTTMHTVGELHANQGDVPHMFCVPIGTRWAAEHRAITEAYPFFDAWSRNASDAPEFYNTVNEDALYMGNATGLPTHDSNGQPYEVGYQFWTPIGQPDITETTIYTPAADGIVLWDAKEKEYPNGYQMGDNVECSLGAYSSWESLKQGGKVSIYGTVNDGGNAKIWVRDAWWKRNFIGSQQNYADFNGYIEFTLEHGNDKEWFGKDGCSIVVLGKNFALTKVVYTAP